jgi:hypothetical protein
MPSSNEQTLLILLSELSITNVAVTTSIYLSQPKPGQSVGKRRLIRCSQEKKIIKKITEKLQRATMGQSRIAIGTPKLSITLKTKTKNEN